MTPFTNPYNFVSLDPNTPVRREMPQMHQTVTDQEGAALYSGRLVCQIVAISPIFIPHRTQGKSSERLPNGRVHPKYSLFFDLGDGIPVIPGATLKGAIRSVAEALANGCMSTYAESYPLPPSYSACSDYRSLCPTCRLFGMSTSDQASEEQLFFRGKVSIGDARWTPDSPARTTTGKPLYLQEVTLAVLSSPKPRHWRFYQKGSYARGRKFYYHRDGLGIVTSGRKTHLNCSIKPLAAGSMFEFEVAYRNLTEAELALLIFALELESKLRRVITGMPLTDAQGNLLFQTGEKNQVKEGKYHKLGYGKPLGLGSAAIHIVRWDVCNDEERYSSPSPSDGGMETIDKQALHEKVLQLKRHFLNPGGNPQQARPRHVQETLCILRWPNRIGEIRYPDRNSGEFDIYLLADPCAPDDQKV